MKIRFTAILLSFMLLPLYIQTVNAATLVKEDVTFNLDTGQFKVTGQLSGFQRKQSVTLLVYKPGMDADKLIAGVDPADVISKADEVKVDNNGCFSFAYFAEDGPTGMYTVNINIGGTVVTRQVFGANSSEVRAAIANINNADANADADTLFRIFDQNKVTLGLPLELYNSLGEKSAYQLAAVRQLFSKKPYSLDSEIVAEFKKAVVLQALNNAKGAADIQRLIDGYNDILGLDVSSSLYSRTLSEREERDMVLDNLAKEDYPDFDHARQRFKELVLLQAINDVASYGQVYPLLSDANNQSMLNIDFTAYDKLSVSGKRIVDAKIADGTFSDLKDVKQAFDQYVEDQRRSESGTSNSGGGGSHSGRVGSASNNSNTIFTADTTTDTNKKAEPKVSAYVDMDGVEWAIDAVNALSDLKIVAGKGNGRFAPNDSITREEFLKMLYLASGQEILDEVCSFTDVDKDGWYYPYIASANKKGLIKGRSDGKFGVGEGITRQDMAVIAVRMLSYIGCKVPEEKQAAFLDSSEIDDYAKVSVDVMYSLGIINGVGNNMFLPKKYSSRAEAAKIIYGIYRYINQ